MKNIADIDKNFKVETSIQKNDIKFYNALKAPIKLYGVFYENGKFRRLPEEVAKNVSDGVCSLHANTAGGRIRFKTDSRYVAIVAKMPSIGKMPHFALTGSAGFDLYVSDCNGENYVNTFRPPFDISNGFEGVIDLETSGMHQFTVNFPLYSDVSELYVGVSENSTFDVADDYKIEKPIVFYGSSITQGGCASRPGNAYQAIVSRRFDCNFINLGFSGNAKAENNMSEYIRKLDMSLFIYDYDHNAPTLYHLLMTHERMFLEFRESHPDTPVIMMTRPKFFPNEDEKQRLDIVKTTYNNAIAGGDKNVYFISGRELMEYAKNEGTVDNCHPNDLGFASMGRVLGDFIEKNKLI